MTYKIKREDDFIYVRLRGEVGYGVLTTLDEKLSKLLDEVAEADCTVILDASNLIDFPKDIRRLQNTLKALNKDNLHTFLVWGNYDYRFHFVLSVLMQVAGVEYAAYANESDALEAVGLQAPTNSSYRWL